jgi:hypothetical protein
MHSVSDGLRTDKHVHIDGRVVCPVLRCPSRVVLLADIFEARRETTGLQKLGAKIVLSCGQKPEICIIHYIFPINNMT